MRNIRCMLVCHGTESDLELEAVLSASSGVVETEAEFEHSSFHSFSVRLQHQNEDMSVPAVYDPKGNVILLPDVHKVAAGGYGAGPQFETSRPRRPGL